MSRRLLTEKVLLVEVLGLLAIVAMLWIDEVLDLPHYVFGVPATPINWSESLLESVLVLLLGVVIVRLTSRTLARLRHIGGFLRVCRGCKRVWVDGRWVPVEDFIAQESATPLQFSHGLCERCLEQYGAPAGPRPRPGGSSGGP